MNENANYEAPKLKNDRVKILWSEDGVIEYQNLVGPYLEELSSRWFRPNSITDTSILLAATNSVLTSAACHTNKFIQLGHSPRHSSRIDPEIQQLQKATLNIHKQRKQLISSGGSSSSIRHLDDQLCISRSLYKKKIREKIRIKED